MNKLYLCLLIGSLSFSKSVDFQEVLDLTLNNNKDLQNTKLDIELSKLNSQKIDAVNFGKLSFINETSRTNHAGYVFNSKLSSREASFNDFGALQYNNPSKVNIEPTNLNYPKARTNITNKITYDLPLFTGFKLQKQKEILKLQQKANEVKYNLNKKELAFEVLKAYNNAVVAKEFIQAAQKAKEAISYVVKSASAFHDEGLVTKIDVKQAKVYKLNTNSKLIEAKSNFALALAYLRFLTSNDSISNVKNLKYISYNISNKKRLYKKALENRDELKMQNIQKQAMKKNIDIAKSSYYPTVYSHLEYGFNDDKFTLDEDKDYYTAMIGLNYDLFDNTRSIEKQKSKIAYQKSVLNYEKLKDAVKLQLEKALLDLKSKEKILKEKYEVKKLAQEVFDQSNLMYKNQLIAMTNLLEQEANLRKNEAELIVAKYQKSLALAKIATVLGIDFSDTNYNKGN